MKNLGQKEVLFMQAGGTIDKSYAEYARSGTYAFDIGAPAFENVLRTLENSGVYLKYRTESVLKRDSLDMTDADRQKLKRSCETAKETKIVLTHGTDTMVSTCEVLSSVKNKTIVLTGSTFPEKQKNSEAWFNIGLAVGAASLLPPGVYIAMSGCIHNWDEVEKNKETGVFESKIKV